MAGAKCGTRVSSLHLYALQEMLTRVVRVDFGGDHVPLSGVDLAPDLDPHPALVGDAAPQDVAKEIGLGDGQVERVVALESGRVLRVGRGGVPDLVRDCDRLQTKLVSVERDLVARFAPSPPPRRGSCRRASRVRGDDP